MKGYDILKLVSPSLAKISTANGWTVLNTGYDWRAFGNAVVELDARGANIQIIRDKGEVFIDARASSDSSWHRMSEFELHLRIDRQLPDFQDDIDFFLAHYNEVIVICSDPSRYEIFLELGQMQGK